MIDRDGTTIAQVQSKGVRPPAFERQHVLVPSGLVDRAIQLLGTGLLPAYTCVEGNRTGRASLSRSVSEEWALIRRRIRYRRQFPRKKVGGRNDLNRAG